MTHEKPHSNFRIVKRVFTGNTNKKATRWRGNFISFQLDLVGPRGAAIGGEIFAVAAGADVLFARLWLGHICLNPHFFGV